MKQLQSPWYKVIRAYAREVAGGGDWIHGVNREVGAEDKCRFLSLDV